MMGGRKKAGKDKSKDAMEVDEKGAEEEKDSQPVTNYYKALKENISILERAVELKDDKNLIRRIWRKNTAIRKHISLLDLQAIIMVYIPPSCPSQKQLLASIDAALKKAKPGDNVSNADKDDKKTEVSLEVESYLHILLVSMLLERSCIKEALQSAKVVVERATQENRRTMDSFVAKGYHYYARCNEILGNLKGIRSELISAHRTACLRLNEQGQAILINLILRSYIQADLVTQAINFDSKAQFPESASNNQQIRHLYYMGRVHAIQADYSRANDKLLRAMRKAPTNTGLGFRVAVYKLTICVQLLMGDTPDRSWFSDKTLRRPLEPYFHLVKAVRMGSVAEYDEILKKYSSGFMEDGILTLMTRLRSSVIKTALRNINLAYSRISFKDIATSLQLGSAMDAELICAKAIRDRIIEATIDGNNGLLVSTDTQDIYSTVEPKSQFNKRIEFCLEIHNSAVKAHRYPPNSHRMKKEADKDLENKVDETTDIDVDLDDAM